MDTNDRLLSVGGQASYPIRDIINQASPTWYTENYYVDGNVSATGDGSEEYPFSTFAEASAASHAAIALSASRHWARRNAIWVCGDRLEEDLVAFPQKTDVIGCGSCDAFVGVGILGNHAPVNVHYGTRFINCNFFPAASADIMTITSSGSGLQFLGCRFIGVWGAAVAPSAIDITAHPMAKILGCSFEGAFGVSVIDIGAGDASGMRIMGNDMIGGAAAGILVTGTVTVAGATGIGKISGNTIYTVGCTINDGDDDAFIITNNTLISDAATGTASLNVDDRWCAGNVITDATKSGPWPRLDDT